MFSALLPHIPRCADAFGEPAPARTPILTKAQGKAVLPIYKRLTDEKLLTRCNQSKTRNTTEALNSKIWLLCPRTRFASRSVVETGTAFAVLWFNRGHSSFECVPEELGVHPPCDLVALGTLQDLTRCQTGVDSQPLPKAMPSPSYDTLNETVFSRPYNTVFAFSPTIVVPSVKMCPKKLKT